MEAIGKKIKRIRKEKNAKQTTLYPSNASLVSQIENGLNKVPKESTLRVISDNLDVSFSELIKGTNWQPNITVSNVANEFVYSTREYTINIEGNDIKLLPIRYPRYDENGKENRFCPRFGDKLVLSCESCLKVINNQEDIFCLGCGKKIELIKNREAIDKCIVYIKKQSEFYGKWKTNIRDNDSLVKFIQYVISTWISDFGDDQIEIEDINPGTPAYFLTQNKKGSFYSWKIILEQKYFFELLHEKVINYSANLKRDIFDERKYHLDRIDELQIALRNEISSSQLITDSENGEDIYMRNSELYPGQCRSEKEIQIDIERHWNALVTINKESKDLEKKSKNKKKESK